MKVWLIRHGLTRLGEEKRYQGRLDDGLSKAGRAALVRADFCPARVYVSPALRARETAEILFPGAEQVLCPELREMDFGSFEGRGWWEMEEDSEYRAWVDGGCLGRCPGGEDKAELTERVCRCFDRILKAETDTSDEVENVVMVAHGGTQMAETMRLRLVVGLGAEKRNTSRDTGDIVSEMRILLAAICGFVLDLILGDPETLTPIHPVVLMGRCITVLESLLRKFLPKTRRGELLGGTMLALTLPLGTLLICCLVLMLLERLWPPLAFLTECIWCWQALAVKNLRDEAMRVYRTLKDGTPEDSRAAVSRIVGRDTKALDRSGVTRATVETVAENFSDGIAAPMLYMFLGGAPLALCYKAINTMDSMVGYKNERYIWFGRAAARLDDAANYIPARLAALILIAAAGLCGEDAKAAARIWKRDRRKHASPNSAQCEAAMAGALGLRLCGPASYFGKLYDKPYIGDALREAEAEDICRACQMEKAGSWLCIGLLGALRLGIFLLVKVL